MAAKAQALVSGSAEFLSASIPQALVSGSAEFLSASIHAAVSLTLLV